MIRDSTARGGTISNFEFRISNFEFPTHPRDGGEEGQWGNGAGGRRFFAPIHVIETPSPLQQFGGNSPRELPPNCRVVFFTTV
jgi:hypothetical protein